MLELFVLTGSHVVQDIQMAMKRFSDLSPDSFISILFVCHFVSSLD